MNLLPKRNDKKREHKVIVTSFFPVKTHKQLKRLAKSLDYSESAFVVAIVANVLEANKKNKSK